MSNLRPAPSPDVPLGRAEVVVVGARNQARADEIARVCSMIGLGVAAVGIVHAAQEAAPNSLRIIDCARGIRAGTHACRLQRDGSKEAPIICIIPRCGSRARALLLEAGADCMLEEPVTPRELLASVLALRRRSKESRSNLVSLEREHARNGNEVPMVPDLRDLEISEIADLGRALHLTETERLLLERVRLSDDAVPSAVLLETVFARCRPDPDSGVVRVHMSRLRKKLQRIGWTIEGLHGFGYRIAPYPGASTPARADDLRTGNLGVRQGSSNRRG
jgi:DNA-binding response OmpR family regulator